MHLFFIGGIEEGDAGLAQDLLDGLIDRGLGAGNERGFQAQGGQGLQEDGFGVAELDVAEGDFLFQIFQAAAQIRSRFLPRKRSDCLQSQVLRKAWAVLRRYGL